MRLSCQNQRNKRSTAFIPLLYEISSGGNFTHQYYQNLIKLIKRVRMKIKFKILIAGLILFLFVGNVFSAPNPASVYCHEVGGTIEVNNTPLGQQGLCVMPDGTKYNSWNFFEGSIGQNYSWCAKNGYGIETICDGLSPYSSCRAVCVFPDGRKQDMNVLMGFYKQVPSVKTKKAKSQTKSLISPDYTGQNFFDWRNYNGSDWTTPVKNQDNCGICWAFAELGVVEAKWNILHNDSTIDIDLSEAHLANLNSNCQGDWDVGVVTEDCLGYTYYNNNCDSSGASVPCSEMCGDWKQKLYTYGPVFSISVSDRELLKEKLVTEGPLEIGIYMGGSFDGNGIYRCTNPPPGNTTHAISIVGYNDTGEYWIIKNSWGVDWGDNGFFKLGYGECNINSSSIGKAFYIKDVKKWNISGCECSSCEECNIQLNDPACSTVKLTADISNHPGTCIDNPPAFNNRTFDCQGHTIDGDGSGDFLDPTYGIYLNGKSGNIIKNCVVTNFYYGIYLRNSSNNALTNNTANYNTDWLLETGYGIYLRNSSDNVLTNNTANYNDDGIHLSYSSNNNLTFNTAKYNRVVAN